MRLFDTRRAYSESSIAYEAERLERDGYEVVCVTCIPRTDYRPPDFIVLGRKRESE